MYLQLVDKIHRLIVVLLFFTKEKPMLLQSLITISLIELEANVCDYHIGRALYNLQRHDVLPCQQTRQIGI